MPIGCASLNDGLDPPICSDPAPGVPDDFLEFHDPEVGDTIILDGEDYRREDDLSLTSNLATLDLMRAMTLHVPGGVALATHVASLEGNRANITVYTVEEMKNTPYGLPKEYTAMVNPPDDVALVHYCAFESLFEQNGERMGRLCSLIVTETIVTLCNKTEPSILVDTNWTSSITNSSQVTFLELADWLGWNSTLDPQPLEEATQRALKDKDE